MLLEDPFLRQFQFKEPSSNPIHMFPSKKGRANNSLGGRGGGRRIPEIPCRRAAKTVKDKAPNPGWGEAILERRSNLQFLTFFSNYVALRIKHDT